MDKRLAKKLLQTYPGLFGVDVFRFQCGSGWFPLIDSLFRDLVELDPNLKLLVAKEKWGFLRVYCQSEERSVANRIAQAESASRKICEICGETAKQQPEESIATRCARHEWMDPRMWPAEHESIIEKLLVG